MEKETIGIVAGGGQFPRLVAQGARDSGFGVAICGFQGHTDPDTFASWPAQPDDTVF